MPVAVDIVVGVDARTDPCPILAALLSRRMSGVKADLTVDLQALFGDIRQEDGCVKLLLGVLTVGIARRRKILNELRTQPCGCVHHLRPYEGHILTPAS